MTDDQIPDLSEKWAERLERVRRSNARSDVRGMTRPPRDPDEREFLRRIGREGPYQEVTVTELLKEAIARALDLPESAQNRVAAIMLEIIERDLVWDETLARPESLALLDKWAAEAQAEWEAGKTEPLECDEM